ncbi:MAG: bifunctional adenosylcobinamide kinase/adenosylcobinamide-phosphate guanylyltransferase [Candidatus Delongbacteria bacterium]|nr:bifunctional adenosylcobinamide kinase/adenosylcobinamide-phosphate guanylyltransferase [Candidatus Delongbacteria bacterium]MBN2834840.1 bifunctional adenosylcobinamide kinase/adenosylcobinamide-phosphate guanylyltransferase [Candidatus Delongbacteria bacterium]
MMAKIVFITGGQRSGKSSFAQNYALILSEKPIYLATSRVLDNDFAKRVERHKFDRDSRWENIEEDLYISTRIENKRVVLIDCITLWLTNIILDNGEDVELSLSFAKNEIDKIMKIDSTIIIVSNEIGMGGHASNDLQRKFTDLQGFINQYIAVKSEEVYLMVSGINVKIKG